jgi:hypothetical protein
MRLCDRNPRFRLDVESLSRPWAGRSSGCSALYSAPPRLSGARARFSGRSGVPASGGLLR